MSVEVQALVWKYAPHKGSTLIVLLALADWSDDNGKSWPSIATLAIKSRQSERNTQYCIRELEQYGYLRIVKRKETSSQYIINISKLEGGAKIAPIPNEGVQDEAGGVQGSAKNLRPVAPNTLVIHQQEHTLSTNPSESFSLVSENSNGKPKKNGKPLKIEIPPWMPIEEWEGWLEMRQKMRKPATDIAKQDAIYDLNKLRLDGENLVQVMRRAIGKNWLSFHAVSNGYSNGNGNGNGQQSYTNGSGATDRAMAMYPSAEENQRRRIEAEAELAKRREAAGL